jgi:hypothetical protein
MSNGPRRRPSVGTVIGRPTGTPTGITLPATLAPDVLERIRRDIAAPPPLMLLPLRLEYRVVQVNVPIRFAGNVAAMLEGGANISLEPRPTPRPAPPRGGSRTTAPFRLEPRTVTFRSQRQIWFRWYPDEDFSLHGVAPPSEADIAALARFDAACGGQAWYALDDPAVVSAWQALSRDVAPERALHLIRHRGEPGDPNHLDALGRITLLPEKVALFALAASGPPVLLGEGSPIDPAVRYSVANIQAGGWHTDFDAALKAGMGLRLTAADAVQRALDASWIIAVGLSKDDGANAMTALVDDALGNGAFEFLRQDSPTNNTPGEPTAYQSPRADLLAFLRTAADAEKGVLASPLVQSAELFAEAIGIDLRHVATAPASGDLAFKDARAMLRVVGPALIDTAVDHTAALRGIDEDAVIAFFEEAVASRGPLPPVRFGKNPYGVLPIVDLDALGTLASDTETEQRIEGFVRDFAAVVGKEAAASADATVPVLQPGDPDAAPKLEAILKVNPVSRRLDVGTVGANDVRALGCAYVTSTAFPVAQYLAELAREPLANLPDPGANETDRPLLYRLARLSLSKKTLLVAVMKTPGLDGVTLNTRVHFSPVEKAQFDLATSGVSRQSLTSLARERVPGLGAAAGALQAASGRFLAALQRLQAIAGEPDGVARLETLLMETIDLFQHRIDAWATGLAYRRLVKRRRAGRQGLAGGYWGLLGRLRADSITGNTDGYLQAPSPHQAATAAILRSAHLRHRDSGAFAIGLDSARVRRGLRLLEMLQAGLSPGEALGYIAERKLHDRKQDLLIFRLRDLFPLRDPRDDAAIETRLSDGLAFLDANIAAMVPAAEANALRALQSDLRQEFDALSDIVLAEATHLRTMGRAEAANAWLQVLSGETIPGLPSVLRTRRAGHGSTHRVVVLIDPVEPQPDATPRAIAEPALAALADAFLPEFDAAFVDVKIAGADGGPDAIRRYLLGADLGLAPIDILVGGESEILLRARHRLITLWRDDAATRAELGPFADHDILTFINQTRPVDVALDVGEPSAQSLVVLAADLRRAVAQGRMLEPSDLSAAADPAIGLTDERERDLLAMTCDALARRVSMLAARLNAAVAAVRSAAGPVVAAARNYRRLADDGADAQALTLALADLTARRQTLDAALLVASRFAEPGALRPIATGDTIANPDEVERVLAAVAGRLSNKAAQLAAATPPATPPANASDARSRRDALVGVLKASLDGDAQPVLPPLPRVPATTPLIEPNPARVVPALAEWAPVRAKIARISKLFVDLPWRAHATSDAATGADTADADERADEGVAPRARLFGTFVSKGDPATTATFTGFMADDWTEQRPSRLQQTGLAINYDSPQSEPPHVLLLCEPAGPAAPPWSPPGAAAMVAEAIELMKARALAAQDRPLPGPLFPFANQVPFKQLAGAGSQPRIPTRRFKPFPIGQVLGDAVFVVDTTTVDVGVAGSGVSEISGFVKVQE